MDRRWGLGWANVGGSRLLGRGLSWGSRGAPLEKLIKDESWKNLVTVDPINGACAARSFTEARSTCMAVPSLSLLWTAAWLGANRMAVCGLNKLNQVTRFRMAS